MKRREKQSSEISGKMNPEMSQRSARRGGGFGSAEKRVRGVIAEFDRAIDKLRNEYEQRHVKPC